MRGFDRGWLVVAAIVVIAIWPFVSRASLPAGTDAELHIFRLVELSYLIRSGEFYPRWAPNFYHGYGYPIFNYYAPLGYYLALVFELLPRIGPVTAVKLTFILAMVAGTAGVYGFSRDNWGRKAGYVAAAVFVYAPYIQYIDPHARGVLAESLSFGMAPLALWALDRLRRGESAWRWGTAVALIAAVVTSHNLMALAFFGVLLAWLVWLWLAGELAGAQWRLLAALGLGVGLAAFFWLPVYLERNAVNLSTLLGEGDNYDFRTHFLALTELLAPTLRLDWGASQPFFRFNLGVAQWVLGGMGAVWALARFRAQRHAAFFAVAGLGLVFMMTAPSQWLWETLPGLPFFQFPWRLLGPAAIMLAISAGFAVAQVAQRWQRWGAGATAVAVLTAILLGLPLSQPAPWQPFGAASTQAMSQIELRGFWLGTTSTLDYIPATVEMVPPRNEAVVGPILAGQQPERINRAVLPDGVEVAMTTARPLRYVYQVSAPRDFLLRLFLFDFPGWRVTIDGEPTQTQLGRPEGFIVIPVSAGDHEVVVDFGTTPARTLGWLVSGVALLATAVLAWHAGWAEPADAGEAWQGGDAVVATTVVGVTAVFLLLLNPAGWLHLNSQGMVAEPAQISLAADFGGQIGLIGADVPQMLQPGDTAEITLYWKAQQPLDINYQVFVHILREDGSLILQSDKLNPADFPTRRWTTDAYVRDAHVLTLPPDFPPGTYTVAAGLWVAAEGWRLPVLAADGAVAGDSFSVATFVVEP